jgi:hypothetical protein
MPFESVVSVGVIKPGIAGFAINWNVPVIGGLLDELVAWAVRVTVSPRLMFGELADAVAEVGYRIRNGADADVTGA